MATASAVSFILTAEQAGEALALVLAVIVCALWPGLVLFLPRLVMGR